MRETFLLIRATSCDGVALVPPLEARIGADGGTIGRGSDNLLVLPDPQRVISRVQVAVEFGQNQFSVRNVGSANAIELNGRLIAPGSAAPLASAGQLKVGGYLIDALVQTERAAPPPAERTVADGRAPKPPAGARLPDDFDVFAGAAKPRRVADEPRPVPDEPARVDPIWEKKDARADQGASERDTPADRPAQHQSIGDLVAPREAQPGVLDRMFNLGAAAGTPNPEPPAQVRQAPHAGGARNGGEPIDDPMKYFASNGAQVGEPEREPPIQASRADHVPEIAGTFVPPQALSPQEIAARVQAERAAAEARARPAPGASEAQPGPSATEAELLRAFCAGAGISMPAGARLTEDQMRLIGELLGESVRGLVRLLQVRATIKQEMRAMTTVMQGTDNNPLKFTVDPDMAVVGLLQPPMKGFLTGPAAVRDGMHDLLGHMVGTMAGTRAAIEGLLKRYDPRELERRIGARAPLLDAILPSQRKARLWELYVEHANSIRRETEEDFHSIFGKAFVQAYEDQIDRLEADDSAPDPRPQR